MVQRGKGETKGWLAHRIFAGNIGKLVRDHMQYFGMKVIYSSRRRLLPEEEKGAEFVSFNDILTRSDVLSINCPLTKETRHLLDKEGEFRGYSQRCLS